MVHQLESLKCKRLAIPRVDEVGNEQEFAFLAGERTD